jgi:hypothetical protein
MSVTIRQAGNEWLIEVQREPVAAACTEAEAHELAEQWTAKLKWRASCRFAPPWLDEEEYNRIFSAHSQLIAYPKPKASPANAQEFAILNERRPECDALCLIVDHLITSRAFSG